MRALALSPRTVTRILLISLILNVFLLGWSAVCWFRPGHGRWLSVESLEQRFASRLPHPDADAFRKILDSHRADLAARMEDLRRSRDGVREVLAAEPFEPSRLKAALEDSQNVMDAFQAEFRSLILAVAPELSAEGRRRLFERHER
jgi:uncharacterized membrane protein